MGCGGSKKKDNKQVLSVGKLGTKAKVVILGSQGVGKTAIAKRYVNNKFDESDNIVTLGGAQFQCSADLTSGGKFTFDLWDTGGTDKYDSITKSYYRNATAAIFVYDITQESTIEEAKKWIEQLSNERETKDMVLAVVANKIDLIKTDGKDSKEIKEAREKGQKCAADGGMLYAQTSAKEGIGIQDLFRNIADSIVTKYPQYIIPDANAPRGSAKKITK